MKTLKLNDNRKMPAIGFGTWQLTGRNGEVSVKKALAAGYRLIDTARIYGNEAEVGKAIRESLINRQDIFLTTKVWTSDLGYNNTMAAFDESLARLGLDDVDLYLIHWPGSDAGLRAESWRALIEIKKSAKAKSIGVSNFDSDQIDDLMKTHHEAPAVNQIEFHPFIYMRQKGTLDFCQQNKIVVEAYSPLAQATDLSNEVVMKIAASHQKKPAQILLRWAIQHGTVPIPRSSNPARMAENLEVFDFELTDEEMSRLNSLSSDESIL